MKKLKPFENREDRIEMTKKYLEGEISEKEYKQYLVYSGVYKIVEGVRLTPNKSKEDKR